MAIFDKEREFYSRPADPVKADQSLLSLKRYPLGCGFIGRLECLVTICHRPSRFTQTSVIK